MKAIIFFLLVSCVITLGQTEIIIIHTNNTNGILENCKCPTHAYGALEKRATIINEIRSKYENVIVLDSGDIFDIQQDSLLHRYIAHAYRKIGYDAWTCGDQDFIEGLEFFHSALCDIPMALISSNLKLRRRNNTEYSIIKKDNVRIGITGSFNPAIFKYIPFEVRKELKLMDQDSSLNAVLSDLVNKSDYQILLSHSGFEKDMYLAEKFPQLDLIIGGHSQTVLKEAEKIGSTLIVQAGESGYRVGMVHLVFKDKKLISVNNELILLHKGVRDNENILKIISDYHIKREYFRRKENNE